LSIAKLDKSIISTDKNILSLEYTILFQVMTRFVDMRETMFIQIQKKLIYLTK